MVRSRILSSTLAAILILSALAACSYPTRRPSDPKTPTEQLLISKAIKRSLNFAETEIPVGTAVSIDTTGLTKHQTFVGHILAGWLGKKGIAVRKEEKDATVRVRVVVQSLGTRRGIKFLGLLRAQSPFIPIALPELALWKRDKRQGYARFYLDMFDVKTGNFLRTSEPYIGSITETKYTVFFFFDWKDTDLDQPLELF